MCIVFLPQSREDVVCRPKVGAQVVVFNSTIKRYTKRDGKHKVIKSGMFVYVISWIVFPVFL